MRKFHFMLIVAMAFLLSACQTARTQPHPSKSQAMAAQEGLATLRRIVNPHNFAALGFKSADEADQATLGEPLPIYLVKLDALRTFTDKTNPETLLSDPKRSLFPVNVSERVATSIFVTESPEGWRATELGNAAVAQLVSHQRHGAGDFIVHVPALQSYFVGTRGEGRLMLTPVMDDPRTELRAGQPVAAGLVFARLRAAASNYNGLPD